MNVADLLPRREDYDLRPRTLRADLAAGVTVGVVALPLALAFGASAGVGPAAGLVTAVVAGIVAAVLGGSNVQVSGPTGAMAVVLAPIVAAHGAGAVALVSVLAGLIVLVAGVARLGRVVGYLPWPVVEGFTLGIACIIALQQVPAALGVHAEAGHDTVVTAVRAVVAAAGSASPTTVWTLGAGAVVAVLVPVLSRLHPGIPSSLVAVVVVTVVAELTHAPVPRIGALPDSLPLPVVPGFDVATLRELAGAALAVAALAAVESLLSARVAASMTRTGYRADRELVGQGLASVASGLFGGMPATGAIARTAVNVRAGARTRLSAVVHALVVLAVLYLATGPVSRIPLAALAGVLLVTSVRMIPVATVRAVVGGGRAAAFTFAVTAVLTVAVDLIVAIEIGIGIAAFFALRHLSRDAGVRREPLPGPAEPGDEHIALFRLQGALFFGAADRILTTVLEGTAGTGAQVVVLRLSGLGILDATGARALGELIDTLEAGGLTVIVKGVRGEHRDVLSGVGALTGLRHPSHLHTDLDEAVAHARTHVRRPVVDGTGPR
ncbi:SulP family inorganic anion transporter [Pseudonocardia sp. ICBG162]|uniref:SulP family inorganic anion transporter n=1 Tax=Pseudonocardia sp. ICBG162 TaxID=2846761 RepID=UPI001CF6E00E|nr:SulP family inorganic anion transporter [Pseudonocardia sp. ICBG162]